MIRSERQKVIVSRDETDTLTSDRDRKHSIVIHVARNALSKWFVRHNKCLCPNKSQSSLSTLGEDIEFPGQDASELVQDVL